MTPQCEEQDAGSTRRLWTLVFYVPLALFDLTTIRENAKVVLGATTINESVAHRYKTESDSVPAAALAEQTANCCGLPGMATQTALYRKPLPRPARA